MCASPTSRVCPVASKCFVIGNSTPRNHEPTCTPQGLHGFLDRGASWRTSRGDEVAAGFAVSHEADPGPALGTATKGCRWPRDGASTPGCGRMRRSRRPTVGSTTDGPGTLTAGRWPSGSRPGAPAWAVPSDRPLVADLPAGPVRARCGGGALGLGPAGPAVARLRDASPAFPVQYGLYTAFTALIAYAIFGTSRQMVQGPSGAVPRSRPRWSGRSSGAAALGTGKAVGYTAALALVAGVVYLAARAAADGLDLELPVQGGTGRLRPRLRPRHHHRPVAEAARDRQGVRHLCRGADRGDQAIPRHQPGDARRRCDLVGRPAAHAPLPQEVAPCADRRWRCRSWP